MLPRSAASLASPSDPAFSTANAVSGVTTANWIAVRDYILYGPRKTPTPGIGSHFYSVADRFCSRKAMQLIIVPAISDLRLEHGQTLADGRQWKAVEFCIRAWWEFASTLVLNL
jgi:hypothetical protein